MRWADDDRWLRWDRKQGDSAEVLGCDALRAERTDPGVAMPGVCVVQLSFCASCNVHFRHWGQARGSQTLLLDEQNKRIARGLDK